MNNTLTAVLKAFLWFICAFHIVVGIGLNVSSGFPQTMAEYYGAEVTWTPEFLYIVKPIGAFMIAIGVMAAADGVDSASLVVVRRAAEFPGPDDEGIVEHSALLQILDQGRHWLVDAPDS